MSVTFAPEYVDGQRVISCSCGDAVSEVVYSSQALAYGALTSLTEGQKPKCGDDFCASYYPTIRELSEAPFVNVSNENAKELLSMLGLMETEVFSENCVGSVSAEDMLGRILLAEALVPTDAGVPLHTVASGEGTATLINCGRAPGYFQDKLALLKHVVAYAAERKLSMSWG